MNALLWDVKCLCNLIGNSTYRTITKDIEDKAQAIKQYPDVINAVMPEEERDLMAKVQTVHCGGSFVQLQAKIAALIPKVEQSFYDADVTEEQFVSLLTELRQLSAMQ